MKRALLKIELIGDDNPDGKGRGWVAEIELRDGGPQRRFLRAFKDYSKANSVGSRGVFAAYWLAPGKIYEVSAPQSWTSTDRYYCLEADLQGDSQKRLLGQEPELFDDQQRGNGAETLSKDDADTTPEVEFALARIEEFLAALGDPGLDARVAVYNGAVSMLADWLGMGDPVGAVRWVEADKVRANDYNPNQVAPPEMRLLHLSIQEDGITQPVVCYRDGQEFEVVDGFHRNRIFKERPDVRKRLKGYMPVVLIDKPIKERIASTIRHNRARGKHCVEPMSDIVRRLAEAGLSDEEIARQIGMDDDEVLRMKQITGLPELFAGRDYSEGWE